MTKGMVVPTLEHHQIEDLIVTISYAEFCATVRSHPRAVLDDVIGRQRRSQSRTRKLSLKTGAPKSARLEFDSCDRLDVNLFHDLSTSSKTLF